MIENGMMNRFQLWLLIVNYTIGSALILIPSTVVNHSKQNGWISMFLATLIGGLLSYMYATLAERYPTKNLVQIGEIIFGRWIGKTIGILYVWFFTHLSALILKNGADFISTMALPETPIFLFLVMAGFLIYSVSKKGIEVIARSNEVFTFFAAAGFWLTILLVLPLIKIEKVSPLMAEGIKPILRGTIPVVAFPFSELVVFLMIFPFVAQRRHFKKVVVSSVLVAGFSLFVVVLVSILVLNIRPTALSVFTTYQLARLISIGDFLTRVEAIVGLAYLLVLFTKMALTFYASLLAIAYVFELREYRPLVAPMIIIVISLSLLLNESIIEVFDFIIKAYTPYALLFGFIIPFALLIGSFIKRNKMIHTKNEP